MKKFTASSPSKIILFGEHAAVYGFPAIVSSLNLKVKVSIEESSQQQLHRPFILHMLNLFEKYSQKKFPNLNINEESETPVGCGLGSSAAIASALFKSLFSYYELQYTTQELFELVMKAETFAHGNPSGIDPTAVVYGGVLEFQRKENGQLHFNPIRTQAFNHKQFFLINSGKPEESTKEMILRVQQLLQDQPHKKAVLKKIGDISSQVIEDCKQDIFHPIFITENERLLEELEVVGSHAKSIIQSIQKIGGFAKVSGGGGLKNGSGIILSYHEDAKKLESLIKENTWQFYKTSFET